MENSLPEKKWMRIIASVLLLAFFMSLFFPLRALTSILQGLMFGYALLVAPKVFRFQKKNRLPVFLIGSCLLFFAWQVISLLYTTDQQEGWKNIWMKSGMVVTTVSIYVLGLVLKEELEKHYFYFCCLLAASLLYCLLVNFIKYTNVGDSSLFFYHSLVRPAGQHAIFMSVYVFAALVFLVESIKVKNLYASKAIYFVLTGFFVALIFLLSSKLAIVFVIFYFFYIAAGSLKKNQRVLGLIILVLVAAGLLVLTKNPVANRFSEIIKGDLELVKQDKNQPADYFNGWQFRLLQWKIVPEILGENRSWLLGVSPGDAQHLLDKKYRERNMYVGDPARGDSGFLGYYTHNTYLEALLQTGIIGLLLIILCFLILAGMAWHIRFSGKTWIILLLIAIAFTESLFESQYGIILFSFLPLFVYLTETQKRENPV